ncbi:methylenetetrahydrofolate dehydrogenase (NAD+) [Exophiala aquamarina CBS 119918]|uniref:Methylenetetrahydrofolate dehydrogenase [NAD(+)] n=1 Tax=Exophiala aquamarina CBS 119918 TaxID=1182545 RepID=A0A072PTE5_9EURO|nr:methylenetetrahydrofolate dehydrogenase (NAD+) [Exophiala aquamarina CBS 119918]KEF63349.1 methylenetetrahydrofolate dehydrogenase (NAD+) [Exophiala aquamarina CBS 119918]
MSKDTSSSCKVILAGTIAKGLLSEIQAGLRNLDRKPHLLGILGNDDPAAKVYADWTQKTSEDNGFQYSLRLVAKDDVEEAILAGNNDPAIDGIIVYYPIFNNRQDQYLQQIVDVSKDVEGLSHQYIFNMYQNIRYLDDAQAMKSILPCTPLAVIKILEFLQIYNTILPYGNRLFGRTICVVNRSEVVGRPLAALLANDGACVYSVDVTGVQQFTRGQGIRKRKHDIIELKDWTLENRAPLCDVVITGVPGDSYKFPTHLLKEGAVCINFSSEKNFTPEVKEKASIYVPAIGKVTIVVLLRNLLRIVQNKQARLEAAAAPQDASIPVASQKEQPAVNGISS